MRAVTAIIGRNADTSFTPSGSPKTDAEVAWPKSVGFTQPILHTIDRPSCLIHWQSLGGPASLPFRPAEIKGHFACDTTDAIDTDSGCTEIG